MPPLQQQQHGGGGGGGGAAPVACAGRGLLSLLIPVTLEGRIL